MITTQGGSWGCESDDRMMMTGGMSLLLKAIKPFSLKVFGSQLAFYHAFRVTYAAYYTARI